MKNVFVLLAVLPLIFAATVDVQVGQNGATFTPPDITINVGDTVRWTWSAPNHNVISGPSSCSADNQFCSPSDGNCASAPTSGPGATYSHTFGAAGHFPYFCSVHCSFGMIGSVTVQTNAAAASATTTTTTTTTVATQAAATTAAATTGASSTYTTYSTSDSAANVISLVLMAVMAVALLL